MKFEVYQQNSLTLLGGGEWRWRLKGDNGETVASGESYVNRQDCLHAIRLIRSTTAFTPVVDASTGMQLMV